MAIQRTRGTIRASKGYAVFRIIFGLFFLGLGYNQYSRLPNNQIPFFTFGIGLLFIGYGVWALFGTRSLGNRIELETDAAPVEERLTELTHLKTSGLISEQEYEANGRRF